jgi:hypothetical protein
VRKALSKVVSAQAMASTFNGPACGLDQDFAYSFQVNCTGSSLGGTFKLQSSLDYNPGLPQSGGGANSGNWADIPNTSVTIAAAGIFRLIDPLPASYPYVRIVYTAAMSDSGNADVYFFTRGF